MHGHLISYGGYFINELNPNVVVSDRDLALVNAIESIFPLN